MWGEADNPTKVRPVKDWDTFALLWDETAGVWVAVYWMSINGASITMWEKPVLMMLARSMLAAMLLAAGGFPNHQHPQCSAELLKHSSTPHPAQHLDGAKTWKQDFALPASPWPYPPRRQSSPPGPRSANRFATVFPSSLASACTCALGV
ncbi:hypothetical protein EDB87DRAFT_1581574 [Lactarius vividus]|nr:hypothetical protein EDB87DRAFT_1581574 [Lactarius vividus]